MATTIIITIGLYYHYYHIILFDFFSYCSKSHCQLKVEIVSIFVYSRHNSSAEENRLGVGGVNILGTSTKII